MDAKRISLRVIVIKPDDTIDLVDASNEEIQKALKSKNINIGRTIGVYGISPVLFPEYTVNTTIMYADKSDMINEPVNETASLVEGEIVKGSIVLAKQTDYGIMEGFECVEFYNEQTNNWELDICECIGVSKSIYDKVDKLKIFEKSMILIKELNDMETMLPEKIDTKEHYFENEYVAPAIDETRMDMYDYNSPELTKLVAICNYLNENTTDNLNFYVANECRMIDSAYGYYGSPYTGIVVQKVSPDGYCEGMWYNDVFYAKQCDLILDIDEFRYVIESNDDPTIVAKCLMDNLLAEQENKTFKLDYGDFPIDKKDLLYLQNNKKQHKLFQKNIDNIGTR